MQRVDSIQTAGLQVDAPRNGCDTRMLYTPGCRKKQAERAERAAIYPCNCPRKAR